MRVTLRRLRWEQDGVTGVVMALLMTVFIGSLALAVDGGLVYVRYRAVRNANDAAALAAALNCAKGWGQDDDLVQRYADANASRAERYAADAYTPGCETSAGKVTVHFEASQPIFFGPAVGLTSPKTVRATATAVWGAAGGATNIAPIQVTQASVLRCEDQPTGSHCYFWWDPNDIGHADWGIMDLSSWGLIPTSTTSCSGYQASQSTVGTWITQGYTGSLELADPAPTYVCASTGSQGGALVNDIDAMIGKNLIFPVDDPAARVCTSGSSYVSCNASTTVNKYAVIGLAVFEVADSAKGQAAQALCPGHPPVVGGGGDVRCIDVVWTGGAAGGTRPTDQRSFGLFAVGLSG